MSDLIKMQEENAERIKTIMKTPVRVKVFDPDCEHKDGGHHMIEYDVQNEEGLSYTARLYQCNLCGQVVEGNE